MLTLLLDDQCIPTISQLPVVNHANDIVNEYQKENIFSPILTLKLDKNSNKKSCDNSQIYIVHNIVIQGDIIIYLTSIL